MVDKLAVKMDASLADHSAGWMDALTVVAKAGQMDSSLAVRLAAYWAALMDAYLAAHSAAYWAGTKEVLWVARSVECWAALTVAHSDVMMDASTAVRLAAY